MTIRHAIRAIEIPKWAGRDNVDGDIRCRRPERARHNVAAVGGFVDASGVSELCCGC